MSVSHNIEGICGNCRHRLLCRNRQARPHPIWQCDEFAPAELRHPSPTTTSVGMTPWEVLAESGDRDIIWKSRGLCATCAHRDTCTFRTSVGGVWHCEEFELAAVSIDETTNTYGLRANPSRVIRRSFVANGAGAFLGLCATCAHRDTCTFRASAGGVWHCEEFE